MNLVHKIETWGDTHHPVVLDPFRIVLGMFLLFKGATFMNNTASLHSIIADQNVINLSNGALMGVVYFIAFAHMVGGMMITFGVLTRIASLIQIPIIIGAIMMSNAIELPGNTDLWLSIVVLAMLIVFSIVGSGKLSIQRILENQ
ncbi:DoxX family protein [Mucilaginibacter paludis]|uniref:DoxX family protein n=1 Tax=Mucilaginibacter paludis DSM 18603 TaxID=714943 RepID=H1Y0Y6_9SPHI|nr:DoxX family membrane protein [Mucilaginibacter paludis]EHQ29211.1 DoxX family protein [Mucilaginibacter paludis DSM 18603]